MNTLYAIVAFVIVIAALIYLGETDPYDRLQDSFYCENVRIYQLSDGVDGWPPYRGTEICSSSPNTSTQN